MRNIHLHKKHILAFIQMLWQNIKYKSYMLNYYQNIQ